MPSDQDCAGKHGDDDNLVKAQVNFSYTLFECALMVEARSNASINDSMSVKRSYCILHVFCMQQHCAHPSLMRCMSHKGS